MPTKTDFQRGEVLAAKYEVVDHLQTSPLGTTYRVKHLKSGRYVRLTLLDPRVASREKKDELINAFKVAKGLEHPNLPRVGELNDHEGLAYFTQEDFEGKTLRELITERKMGNKPFELREAAQIATQILDALGALHANGMIYRALRPEYVLVNLKRTGPRGANVLVQTRLLNVGFWELVSTGALAEDEYQRSEAQYLAPELKSFDPDASVHADIYSAGVIYYELLVGSAPMGTFQLPRQRRPDLPKAADDVVELALSNAPADRFPSVGDFSASIQRTFDAAAMEPESTGPAVPPRAWALMAVLVLAMAVIMWNNRGDPYDDALQIDQALRSEMLDEVRSGAPSDEEMRAILKAHPDNMVYVPAGPYLKGKLNSELEVREPEPIAERAELGAFMIDAFEYPNLQGGQPQINVSYRDAEKICADAGKRLCTAPELEKACKGQQNLVYGYSDSFDPDMCGAATEVHTSGQLGECRSDWGVYDIAGNFREWTSTPRPGSDGRRLVKGGDPSNPERGGRCAYSTDLSTGFTDATMSFRCCMDL